MAGFHAHPPFASKQAYSVAGAEQAAGVPEHPVAASHSQSLFAAEQASAVVGPVQASYLPEHPAGTVWVHLQDGSAVHVDSFKAVSEH